MHDFHVPIAPSGLYWVTSIAGDQLRVAADIARLDVGQLAGIDEPQFPMDGPVYPARQSFRITWTAAGAEQTLRDDGKQFDIVGRPATVEAEFTASVPSMDFTFEGRATATTYAFFGREVNGHYFDQDIDPASLDADG